MPTTTETVAIPWALHSTSPAVPSSSQETPAPVEPPAAQLFAPEQISAERPGRPTRDSHPIGGGRRLAAERDERLADRLEQAYRASGYFALRSLSCHAADGVVTLWGELPSFHLKQLAQEIAARLPGVRRVVNHALVVA